MNITAEQAEILREHGFKWYKSQSTDSVPPECIAQIIPFEEGFAVVYNQNAVLAVSIAKISQIEWVDDPAKQWNYVHWDEIVDYRWDEMVSVLDWMQKRKSRVLSTDPS